MYPGPDSHIKYLQFKKVPKLKFRDKILKNFGKQQQKEEKEKGEHKLI